MAWQCKEQQWCCIPKYCNLSIGLVRYISILFSMCMQVYFCWLVAMCLWHIMLDMLIYQNLLCCITSFWITLIFFCLVFIKWSTSYLFVLWNMHLHIHKWLTTDISWKWYDYYGMLLQYQYNYMELLTALYRNKVIHMYLSLNLVTLPFNMKAWIQLESIITLSLFCF